MERKDLIIRMEQKGVKPTANRLIVVGELSNAKTPLSLADLTERLPEMDKSSLFRVLTLFLQHDVVDAFVDGRGIVNYELCETEARAVHHENHMHFYCEFCHKSYCLRNVPIRDMEEIVLPEGFLPRGFSLVVKGVCPLCQKQTDKT